MEASTEQEPTIEERLAKLYAEMDVIVAAYVDQRAAAVPGVHRGSVESSILARADGCRCEEFKLVRQLITTAAELARKHQEADRALPEG
jgi:hypothetical protein